MRIDEIALFYFAFIINELQRSASLAELFDGVLWIQVVMVALRLVLSICQLDENPYHIVPSLIEMLVVQTDYPGPVIDLVGYALQHMSKEMFEVVRWIAIIAPKLPIVGAIVREFQQYLDHNGSDRDAIIRALHLMFHSVTLDTMEYIDPVELRNELAKTVSLPSIRAGLIDDLHSLVKFSYRFGVGDLWTCVMILRTFAETLPVARSKIRIRGAKFLMSLIKEYLRTEHEGETRLKRSALDSFVDANATMLAQAPSHDRFRDACSNLALIGSLETTRGIVRRHPSTQFIFRFMNTMPTSVDDHQLLHHILKVIRESELLPAQHDLIRTSIERVMLPLIQKHIGAVDNNHIDTRQINPQLSAEITSEVVAFLRWIITQLRESHLHHLIASTPCISILKDYTHQIFASETGSAKNHRERINCLATLAHLATHLTAITPIQIDTLHAMNLLHDDERIMQKFGLGILGNVILMHGSALQVSNQIPQFLDMAFSFVLDPDQHISKRKESLVIINNFAVAPFQDPVAPVRPSDTHEHAAFAVELINIFEGSGFFDQFDDVVRCDSLDVAYLAALSQLLFNLARIIPDYLGQRLAVAAPWIVFFEQLGACHKASLLSSSATATDATTPVASAIANGPQYAGDEWILQSLKMLEPAQRQNTDRPLAIECSINLLSLINLLVFNHEPLRAILIREAGLTAFLNSTLISVWMEASIVVNASPTSNPSLPQIDNSRPETWWDLSCILCTVYAELLVDMVSTEPAEIVKVFTQSPLDLDTLFEMATGDGTTLGTLLCRGLFTIVVALKLDSVDAVFMESVRVALQCLLGCCEFAKREAVA
eukprot:jgi/Hompol1/332/HPOL_005280-RA